MSNRNRVCGRYTIQKIVADKTRVLDLHVHSRRYSHVAGLASRLIIVPLRGILWEYLDGEYLFRTKYRSYTRTRAPCSARSRLINLQ